LATPPPSSIIILNMGIRKTSRIKKLDGGVAKSKKLVDYVAYCLNPNHYHFILKQLRDDGIIELMKKLGGYSWYFNNRYKRVGPLFQGPFKAIRIESNDYLLHLSAYVNLNHRTHRLGGGVAKLSKSSWEEYIDERVENVCVKDIILDQFKNRKEYKDFAGDALEIILKNKSGDGLEELLLDYLAEGSPS